jgi:thiamine biosynthesis lipoprotein
MSTFVLEAPSPKGVSTRRAAKALGGRSDATLYGGVPSIDVPSVAASNAREASGWHVREAAVMGTAVRVELWADDHYTAQAAAAAVIDEMHRIDRTMSPHKPDSILSQINRGADAAPFEVSAEMIGLLTRAIEFSDLTDGAFDITYASAGQLYDYREQIRPDDAALAAGTAAIGWRGLLLDAGARTVRFVRPGMRIDLGGFAKGHAVDNAVAILSRHGIRHAYVSAGGDSRVIGDRRGRPWTIAVRHPRRPGEVVAVLPLQDVAISTSGDYERYFERDGVRCHHLLDPRTGRSPQGVHSVTILADDGLTAEALSKAVFVRGAQAGLRLVNALPGVDAVVIDATGRLHRSAGLLHAGGAPN